MKDVIAENIQFSNWLLEETACPLCGSSASRETPYAQPPFLVKQCSSCTLFFLSPRLSAEEAQRFYTSDQYFCGGDVFSGYDDYEAQEASLRATFRKLVKTINAQNASGGALLDVGCGPGYLLDEARGFFDMRTGVELSPATARKAADLTGCKIYLSVEEIDEGPFFDCIVATHVIEHVYEPVDFVKSLARRLKPGGSIILAAPHMGSIFRRVMGRHWPSFKYPEHVSFFDQKTLPYLFKLAGLDVVGRVPYPHVFPLSLVLSKCGILGPGWTKNINVTLPATTICFRGKHRNT